MIENKILTKAVIREFRLQGRLVSEIVSMFLETDDNSLFVIYFDDEENEWILDRTEENPEPGGFIGDEQFQYPHVDAGKKFNINGLTIQKFATKENDKGSEAVLLFENGKRLVFFYDNESEKESVTCDS